MKLKMRLIAAVIPLFFVITTAWASAKRHDKQEEIETHADRKRDQNDGPGS